MDVKQQQHTHTLDSLNVNIPVGFHQVWELTEIIFELSSNTSFIWYQYNLDLYLTLAYFCSEA